jgi:XTP/dITP diphosphohydrolase
MKNMKKILLATNNQHKIQEIQAILADLSEVELVTPREIGLENIEPEENGATYRENAEIKARAFAAASGLAVLADDSGVETVAFPGFPGVKSARWHAGSDQDRMLALWEKMKTVSERGFIYQATMCYFDPATSQSQFFEGALQGKLAAAPRGRENFGYDPLMIPDGENRTLSEMTMAEKNQFRIAPRR